MNGTTVSIVVPVMNEEECVFELAQEISEVTRAWPWKWECLWVNDGSTDGTLRVLEQITQESRNHRFIDLNGHFGQSAALAAGFVCARGEVIATLDGDGQNDPHDLPLLIGRLLGGSADMVNGVRTRRHDNLVRRISSRIANGFRNWLTREHITDVGCSIRVFRRECVEGLPIFKGMHRFLPTLVRMKGYQIVEVSVKHRPRIRGKTKYGIHDRLWVGLADTLAVCWMKRRLVWPSVRRTSDTKTEQVSRHKIASKISLPPHLNI